MTSKEVDTSGTTSKDKLGPNSEVWKNAEEPIGETFSWTGTQNNPTVLYWHVLTYDKAGNYTETVHPNPIQWITTTRIFNYTEAQTTPSGWSVTEGSFTYRGLKQGTFRSNNPIDLSIYSFLTFSIYTRSDGYGAHAVYIDFINTSGSCVKTLQYEWEHGSSCINPYGPYTGSYSTSLVPAGSYYIQVRARATRGVYSGFVAENSYIDLIP